MSARIDWTVRTSHVLASCPECGSELGAGVRCDNCVIVRRERVARRRRFRLRRARRVA